jgi:tetratricopeptide (TPR) repeat protein
MTGWIWLGAIGLAAMGLLVAFGVKRPLWSLVGAALMMGAVGYAWQGRPDLPGRAAQSAQAATVPDDPELIVLRDNMMGRFTLDGAYLIASDAMISGGDNDAAIRVLLGGIGKIPQSYALWTALGSAYARHDGGQMSPPARFAFDQAARLAPNSPAPPFFAGLAFLRAGDLASARPLWARALRLSPPRISYRREIAERLQVLDRIILLQRGAPPPR